MMRAVAALTLALLMVATAVPAAAQSLDDVVREIESVYSRMTDLRADFTQTAFNKSLNQTIPARGTVYLKKGGKLRWEYTEPTPQEIVSATAASASDPAPSSPRSRRTPRGTGRWI